MTSTKTWSVCRVTRYILLCLNKLYIDLKGILQKMTNVKPWIRTFKYLKGWSMLAVKQKLPLISSSHLIIPAVQNLCPDVQGFFSSKIVFIKMQVLLCSLLWSYHNNYIRKCATKCIKSNELALSHFPLQPLLLFPGVWYWVLVWEWSF